MANILRAVSNSLIFNRPPMQRGPPPPENRDSVLASFTPTGRSFQRGITLFVKKFSRIMFMRFPMKTLPPQITRRSAFDPPIFFQYFISQVNVINFVYYFKELN